MLTNAEERTRMNSLNRCSRIATEFVRIRSVAFCTICSRLWPNVNAQNDHETSNFANANLITAVLRNI